MAKREQGRAPSAGTSGRRGCGPSSSTGAGASATSPSGSTPCAAPSRGGRSRTRRRSTWPRWTPCGRRGRGRAGRAARRALGVSAILHSLVPQGPGAALGPSIIWADNRSVAEAEAIKGETDALALYHRTGCPVHPCTSPKLRWLRQHRPQAFDGLETVESVKEYVLRWTGLSVTDRSVASGSGLYDLRGGTWDAEALRLAQISPRSAPLVEPAPLPVRRSACGRRASPRAAWWCRGRGRGAADDRGRLRRPGADGGHGGHQRGHPGGGRRPAHGRAGAHLVLLPGRGALGGRRGRSTTAGWCWTGCASSSPGDRRELRPEQLTAWAEEVAPGADGLLFLPYLAGERSPNWNANAQGCSSASPWPTTTGTWRGRPWRGWPTACAPSSSRWRRWRGRGGDQGRRGLRALPLWLQIVADVLGAP